MDWFKRKKGIASSEKKVIPDGLWDKCDRCGEIIYRPELLKRMFVCAKCGFHFRITSKEYIACYFDEGSFEEFNQHIKPSDPLKFKDSKKYADRLKAAQKATGLNDAVVTGEARVEGHPVVAAVMDFSFIGGSMGSVVGEKICRAIDRSREQRTPLIIISASGGARMMESALSLMQLAKTSAKLAQLDEAGIPYISILTDPTTGGTTASFAMLGDIHIAEPGALIGFAGQRVIKQTIGQDLPEGFQTAEFLQEHGFIDMIVHRQEMREILGQVLELLWPDEHRVPVSNNQMKESEPAEYAPTPKTDGKNGPERKISAGRWGRASNHFRQPNDLKSYMINRPKILVTNDDGIFAPGIFALQQAMQELGDTFVVAPDSEKSAVGHAITLADPLRVTEVARYDHFFGWAVNGTPADCVKLGVKAILEFKPDLVVSGINQGSNTAVNVIYSGTVSAATEGAIMGLPAVAFSLTSFTHKDFSAAAGVAKVIAQEVLRHGLPEDSLLSVNIPPVSLAEIKGIRATRQGRGRYEEFFEKRVDPARRTYYWLAGKKLYLDTDEDVDEVAISQSYVTVTPLQLDFTNHKFLSRLREWDFKL